MSIYGIRSQVVGELEPVVGLRAAPDQRTRGRLSRLLGRSTRDLSGGVDANAGVRGYDRGDAAHSLTGWVEGVPSPTAAIAAVTLRGGIYGEPATYEETPQLDPSLDPYRRLAFARMANRR